MKGMSVLRKAKRAVIIGCGIAGPATALFLQRAGIEAEIYEASELGEAETGLFLNVARNGMRILQELGLDDEVRRLGIEMYTLRMMNSNGKLLGTVEPKTGEPQGYTLKRQELHHVLREAAQRNGIPITFGKRLQSLETNATEGAVTAHFTDSSTATGDFIVGCDGIHSRTRKCILPDAPPPTYTGLISFGGYLHKDQVPHVPGAQHLIFGKKAFFGYLVHRSGEVYWFGNLDYPGLPTRRELMSIPQNVWREKIEALYKDDVSPVPDIVRETPGDILFYPIYDMPPLPRWHVNRIVLVGDAVHATSPNAGQGASLALEDAMVLAKCVRDIPDLDEAFHRYRELRKERVERIVRYSRQLGSRKHATHPVQVFFRDLLLPFFLRQASKQSFAWLYDYHIDWKQTVSN